MSDPNAQLDAGAASYRNGNAQKAKALYGGAIVACVAMLCVAWGNQSQGTAIMGFAAMFMFQFWNYLKGDAAHATSTAAAVAAKESARQAAIDRAAIEELTNKNFSDLKRAAAVSQKNVTEIKKTVDGNTDRLNDKIDATRDALAGKVAELAALKQETKDALTDPRSPQ
jgi:hypothetical protein